MAEIVPVTSETLEAQIRDLLPSQRGFGEDLQASNVITPIIDLTAAAEGSTLAVELQNAWDFSTSLATQTNAGSTTAINTPGFYKVDYTATYNNGGSSAPKITITDGLSSKTVWIGSVLNAGSGQITDSAGEFYIYLRAGDSLVITGVGSTQTNVWSRQVADVNGNLTNPLGFNPQ